MKAILVTALALALSAPAAFAATAVPLDPGKPAGVHQAQLLDDGNGMLVVAGAALVGIGIALATASGDAAQPTATNNPPPTTGTSP
jgi:hypothetical protein